jgi:circadian clock protein KaiB
MHFKLYVVKQSKGGAEAISNLKSLLESDSSEKHEYVVIDVFENPSAAEKDRILATPTLVRESPEPKRRLMGSLEDLDLIKRLLGI